MGLLIIIMTFWLYVGLQQALFVPIDYDIPSYKTEGLLPITDIIYRTLRVAGCICVVLTIKGLLPYGIGFYVLAWLIKKIAIYLTYER